MTAHALYARIGFGRYDDEDDRETHAVSPTELIGRIRESTELFAVERDTVLPRAQVITCISALCLGWYFMNVEVARGVSAIIIPRAESVERSIEVLREPVTDPRRHIERPRVLKSPRVPTVPPAQANPVERSSTSATGNGSPMARLMKENVFASANAGAADDVLSGEGGFAKNIDRILQNAGRGLSRSHRSGANGRRGFESIGFGLGPAGHPEGTGLGDEYDRLMRGSSASLELKGERRKEPISAVGTELPPPRVGTVEGMRNRADIQRTVLQNIPSLRHSYNRRLQARPGLAGKVTVRFAIDEYGNVLYCEVLSSTLRDAELERTIQSQIKRWRFRSIDRTGDVTVIEYPFVFSA